MKLQVTELNLFRSAVCVARTFKEAILDLGSKTLPVCLFGGRRRVCLYVTWSRLNALFTSKIDLWLQ